MKVFTKHIFLLFILLFFIFQNGFCQEQKDSSLNSKHRISKGFNLSLIFASTDKSVMNNLINYNPNFTLGINKNLFTIGTIWGNRYIDFLISYKKLNVGLKAVNISYSRQVLSITHRTKLYFQFNFIYEFLNYQSKEDFLYFYFPHYGNYQYSYQIVEQIIGYKIKINASKYIYFNQSLGLGYGFGSQNFDFDNDKYDNKKNFSGLSFLFRIGSGVSF